MIEELWEKIEQKLVWSSREIGDLIPYVSQDGIYKERGTIRWWTNGFYPGILWILYEETGDSYYRRKAERIEGRLDNVLYQYDDLDHDVGFLWLHTAVKDFQQTGNDMSRQRGLRAASMLASRFELTGNYIRAWNGKDTDGMAIIDCMMNIPLLYWATVQTGDRRFADIACAHADTTLRHFIRPDGSVNHIVTFDTDTGEPKDYPAGQGFTSGSVWSRGQAWAIHGFAQSYAATKEVRYLDAAKRTAHYFIANLGDDCLPKCDFRQPPEPDIRDSSAGAIAASGLIHIAELVDEQEQEIYWSAAQKILRIYETQVCDWSKEEQGLLRMATGGYHNSDNIHLPMIFGDYYFVEAVRRMKRWKAGEKNECV